MFDKFRRFVKITIRSWCGIEKPIALGYSEWGRWNDRTKAEHPVGWFLTETIPKYARRVYRKTIGRVGDFRCYLDNRFVAKTHAMISTTLPKGKWCELDARMLHCNFDAFVDFVEIDVAMQERAWNSEKYKQVWYKHTPRRHVEAAMARLKWEMGLDEPTDSQTDGESPRQAAAAYETMALYSWWKHIRPNRKPAFEASGLGEYWDKMDAKYGDDFHGLFGSKMTAVEKAEYSRLSTINELMDAEYEAEDNAMLIRLINHRRNLWT